MKRKRKNFKEQFHQIQQKKARQKPKKLDHRSKPKHRTVVIKTRYEKFLTKSYFYIWQTLKALAIMFFASIPDIHARSLAIEAQSVKTIGIAFKDQIDRADLLAIGILLLGVCLVLFKINWKRQDCQTKNPHLYKFLKDKFVTLPYKIVGSIGFVVFLIIILVAASAVITFIV